MPADRYTDWTHVHVLGDRAAAATHVPYARKLLGWVMQDAAHNQLGTHKATRKLSDGTVVIAEVHGAIPRITIVNGGGGGGTQSILSGDFIVWARDINHPNGIDNKFPQQILRPKWETFFKDKDVGGYAAFSGRKGTYGGVFQDGVRFAGNIDWKGKDDSRISWYGPSTRYWLDPHVEPRFQYGKFVFLLGSAILDVEDYIARSEADEPFEERWVMGAALRGPRLYVMHANLPEGVTDTSPAPTDSCDISTPWPAGNVNYVLCQYSLIRDSQVKFHVANNSREVLWAGSLPRALNPWFFNESCTQAVSMGLPESVLARRHIGPTNLDEPYLEGAPSTTNAAFTATLKDGKFTVATAAVSCAVGGEAVIAADFRGDTPVEMTVLRRAKGNLSSQFVFRLGALELEARRVDEQVNIPWPNLPGGRATQRGQKTWLLFADLRTETVVAFRFDWYYVINAATNNRQSETVFIYRKGVEVGSIVIADNVMAPPDDTGFLRSTGVRWGGDWAYDHAYAGVSLAPMFAIYGHITQWQAQPTWDWSGHHGIYSFRAYPANNWFGAARITAEWHGNTQLRIDDSSDCDFESNKQDFNEHFSALGCATIGEHTMLSCYGFEYMTGKSVNWVDNGNLGELTGVGGDKSRYHPIWILGKPPQQLESA